jgi:hypothetical protein
MKVARRIQGNLHYLEPGYQLGSRRVVYIDKYESDNGTTRVFIWLVCQCGDLRVIKEPQTTGFVCGSCNEVRYRRAVFAQMKHRAKVAEQKKRAMLRKRQEIKSAPWMSQVAAIKARVK